MLSKNKERFSVLTAKLLSTLITLLKTTIFLTDMNRFSEVNEIYGKYFDGDFPARETVQVSALPKFVNVEISMIAVK